MQRWGIHFLYAVALPVIVLAAGILGYFSLRAASRADALSKQTIGESTLVAVRDRVDNVERAIIDTDHRVFGLFDPEAPGRIVEVWPRDARELSPSVRAVTVLDEDLHRVAQHVRGSEEDHWRYWRHLKSVLLPRLEPEKRPTDELKHLHYEGPEGAYLLSHLRVSGPKSGYHVVLHHDVGYLLRETLPAILGTDEGNRIYNIVGDDSGVRVFGQSLDNSGVFVVGRRFPTTLYRWRLQAAPARAPLLEQQSRTRRINEGAFIAAALAVVLVGVLVILFAVGRERRFNAQKSEFLANASHELKTPISVVRMFAEMLVTGRVTDPAKERQYLSMIARESERLATLVDNVLDFAALEGRRRTYALREGNVVDVVRRTVESFRSRADQEGVRVDLSVPDAPVVVRHDEHGIALALMNLLDNASKYGLGTPIEVSVVERDGRVDVSVRDHGPGIPAEDLRRVFDRFFRSRGREAVRGSGIGLSIVAHIAGAHGGKAWARNAEGGGAIVAFSLARGRAKVPA